MNRILDETGIMLKDQFLDLKGLSLYSSLGVGTLREYLRSSSLPHYRLRGKILIKRSEFDDWMQRFRTGEQTLDSVVDEILDNLKIGKSDKISEGHKK